MNKYTHTVIISYILLYTCIHMYTSYCYTRHILCRTIHTLYSYSIPEVCIKVTISHFSTGKYAFKMAKVSVRSVNFLQYSKLSVTCGLAYIHSVLRLYIM